MNMKLLSEYVDKCPKEFILGPDGLPDLKCSISMLVV